MPIKIVYFLLGMVVAFTISEGVLLYIARKVPGMRGPAQRFAVFAGLFGLAFLLFVFYAR